MLEVQKHSLGMVFLVVVLIITIFALESDIREIYGTS